jgi:hypothetical protein
MHKLKIIGFVAAIVIVFALLAGFNSTGAGALAPGGITETPTETTVITIPPPGGITETPTTVVTIPPPDATETPTPTTAVTDEPPPPSKPRPTKTPEAVQLPVTGEIPPGPAQSLIGPVILLLGALAGAVFLGYKAGARLRK